MLILLTVPATAVLYYGDELGMTGAKVAPHQAVDRWGAQTPDGALGRDPQRSPMQWTAGDNAGFCPPGVDPWLPIGGDADTANVTAQRDDPYSMLRLTRRPLQLRSASPALAEGDLVLRGDVPDDVLAYERRHAGERMLVAVNFAATSARVTTDVPADIQLTTSANRTGSSEHPGLTLSPHEAVIVRLGRERGDRVPIQVEVEAVLPQD